MQDDTRMIDTVSANAPLPSEMQTAKTHFRYLYNLDLVAYDVAIEHKVPFQFFKVKKLEQKRTTPERVEAVRQIDLAQLPSVRPTDEEISLDDDISNPNAIVVLWVGMRPATAKLREQAQEDTSVSEEDTSVSDILRVHIAATNLVTLRVVCVKNKATATATFYALTTQDETTGLCSGVMVGIDEVFFFPEFRDDTSTSYADRTKKWVKKVQYGLSLTSLTKRCAKRTHKKTKFSGPHALALSAEVESLSQAYNDTGEAGYLRAIKTLIDSHEVRLKSDRASMARICKSINSNSPPDQASCQRALKEAVRLWPKLDQILTPRTMEQIGHCLRAANITLSYNHIRPFLVECERNIASFHGPLDDDVAAYIGKRSRNHVYLLADEHGELPEAAAARQ